MLKDLHGRLRPMGISDILDEAAELYKRSFLLLVGTAGVVYIPYFIISGLILGERQVVPKGVEVGNSVVSFAVAIVISSIVTGALTFAISDRYLDRPASVGGSYGRMLKSSVFWSLLGALFVKNLILFAPLILLLAGAALLIPALSVSTSASVVAVAGFLIIGAMVPGLICMAYFGVRFALVEPAVVLESRGSLRSLGRSWTLIRGNVGKGFWLLVIVGLFVGLVVAIATGPTTVLIAMKSMRHEQIAQWLIGLHTILTAIVQTVAAPLTSVASILLYYDMRIRKEGFDLELLARELDQRAQEFMAQGTSSLPQETMPEDTSTNA